MAERKIFGIFKQVPLVGHTYGALRGIVYAAKGDKEEARHSVEFDLTSINPLRAVKGVTMGIVNAIADLDEDIWIGRRTLGDQPFGLTFFPGSDGFHWCIQIDGTIYQLLLNGQGDIIVEISSKNERRASYESDCKRFSWQGIAPTSSCISSTIIRDYAKSFESYKYQAVLPVSREKINCQFFVKMMLAKAADMSPAKAAATILLIMPNAIY